MARGTELAVGYVSLVAETSQLSRGINQALGQAGRDAQSHGNRMGAAMGRGARSGFAFRPNLAPGIAAAEQTGKQMGQRMGNGMVGQLRQFMTGSGLAATGILGVTAGLGAAMTVAVRTTTDFQSNLNKLQGASRATEAEMAKVQARARELGNDTQLAGTSALDAASAMTELVKGGFSVAEAMSAARGTLQLATAAQVDAAQAATIQADALHAFRLEADQAGRVADVLANVANASTGEMADFALGLQAGGAVMNQFGLSVEEGVATLGLLANAGIKSSDAGTLVKSMLLALASPSEEAAGALADLNLKAFDAQGNFRGMEAIMEDLQDAYGRMTPEAYAMATSTAFGSDAARLAGIAAAQGGEGFDKMRIAVEREGTAAEVAAANMKGLPGVFERLSNTADRAKLSLGDLVSGPLQSVGNALNEGINNALDAMEGKTGGGGPIGDIADAAKDLAPAVKAVAESLLEVLKGVGSAAWTGLSTVLSASAEAASVLAPVLEGIGGLVGSQAGLVTALAAAWGFHKFVTPALTRMNDGLANQAGRVQTLRNHWTGFRDEMRLQQTLSGQTMSSWGQGLAVMEAHNPTINRMADSFRTANTNAGHFGRTIGTVRAGMSGLSSAASGLVGVLGGPWGAALAAATVGLTLWASSASDNKQRAEGLQQAQTELAASYKEMYDLLSTSGGQVNDTVIAKATEQVDIFQQKLDTLRTGATPGDWLRGVGSDMFGLGDFDLGDAAEKQGAAENVERIKDAMAELGVTSQQLGGIITGSGAAFDQFTARARAAGDGGNQLAIEMQGLRQEFLDNQAAAARLTPGVAQLEAAIKVLGDSTATAADKSNALKSALDLLAGKAPDQAEAQKKYNDTMRETAEATQAAIDQTQGFGEQLVNTDGSVNTASANGSKLYENLQKIKDATIQVASSGGNLQEAYQSNTVQFQQLATQLGLTEAQVRTMAEAMGLVPQRIDTLVNVNDDEVTQQITTIKAMLTSVPPGKTITVDAPPENVIRELEAIGLKVEWVPGSKTIDVSAPSQAAIDELERLKTSMTTVPSKLTITTIMENIAGVPGAAPPPGSRTGPTPSAGDLIAPPGFFPYTPGGGAEGGSAEGISGQAGIAGQDSLPSLLMPGEHVWTTDEVMNVGGHANMERLRAMARAGLLTPFETGGPVGPVDPRVLAIDAAYRASGRPYEYGPWDCSMYMSHIYGAMSGRGGGRHFNTESDFEALGFKKGFKPGALNIGIRRGGGGRNSHMAGTLPNGVNVENGGANGGSVYGPGASGASDFPLQYYYEGETAGLDMVSNPTGQPNIGTGGPQAGADWEAMAQAESGGNWQIDTGNGFYGGLQFTADSWKAAGGEKYGALPHMASKEQQIEIAENLLKIQGPGAWPNTFKAAPVATGSPGGTGASMSAAGQSATGDARTEGLIPAGAGNTAPAGSGMIGGLTGMAVQAINAGIDAAAQAGAMGANAFAPGAGAGVQMGAEAAKRLVQYGGEMVGIWGDALMEIALPFGTPRWMSDVNPTAFIPQPRGGTVATTTLEQGAQAAATQMAPPMPPPGQHTGSGVPPGPIAPAAPAPAPGAPPGPPGVGTTPNAASAITGPALNPQDPNMPWKLPFGIFDEGGVLAPSSAAVNMSTTPEMVLTQEQWDSVAAGAAKAPLYPEQQALDFSTHIESVSVGDVDELTRKLDSRGRLAMMRYSATGRHK